MGVSARASETESAASARVQVSAVIPCLNEERTIAACIQKARQGFETAGVVGEVVVADNGSTDRSVEIARSLGARVVHESVKGYGAALRRGMSEAQGEIIVLADADESYDWSRLCDFVHKIQNGYDLVMGNRFTGGIAPGAMPPLHRYFGNPVLSAVARIAFRVKIGDFHCGMRAVRKEAFERMLLQTDGMEFATEMVANAACQGMRITEIPTRLYPDKRGRPPHLRSFRDGWRHLRHILTYAPDHLYLAPGGLLLLAGLALQALLCVGPVRIAGFYMGIHFLALGALLTLAGFNILNLGIFAKLLMSQRYKGLQSRTVRLLRERFALEYGMIPALLLISAGLSINVMILVRWLQRPGAPMESTVHPAFVAATMVVLGLNILFSSFLVSMIRGNEKGSSAHSAARS